MKHEHAVVVGGSFAGFTAARVLLDHFEHVTVIERDEFPDALTPRKGVPQSPHVHGILKLGRDLLEDLLPGFIADTERNGAVLFDQIATGAMYSPTGWSARGRSNVLGYGVRRALLEYVARERVRALPGVTFVRGRVDGLLADPSSLRVYGVTVDQSDDGTSRIEGDLVVDAGGRASAAPAWLEAAGLTPPEETLINGFVGYASRWVRVPDDAWPGDMRFIAQLPMPGQTKGAILYPQDNGLHVISLFGHSRDYPPGDEQQFMSFLSECTVPLFHPVVERAEVVSAISTSRSTANRWRHYERLTTLPTGFIAIGDAVATANPIFGQGISNAVMGSVMLGRTIGDLEGDLDRLPAVFPQELAQRLAYPWQMAVGFDLRFPATIGERPEPTPEAVEMGHYMNVLAQMGTVDVEVVEALLIANQTYNPGLLRDPELVAKAEQWVADGRTPANTDPARPPRLAA